MSDSEGVTAERAYDWTCWDAAVGAPGPVHHRRDPGKRIWWDAGAHPADLVYFASPSKAPPAPGSVLVLTEGEKAADAAAEAGYAAAATVCGAGATPTEAVIRLLARYRVILAPDHDEPGENHMQRIAGHLEQSGVLECRRVVPPESSPASWDLADAPIELRRRLIDAAVELGDWGHTSEVVHPAPRSILQPLSEFLAEGDRDITDDLVPGILGLDTFTLFVGRRESFKTMAALDLLVAAASGTPWLGQPVRVMPAVYVSGEKRSSSVRSRLKALTDGVDLVRPFHVAHREGIQLSPDDPGLLEAVSQIEEFGERTLVVLDTLSSLAPARFDENDGKDMRGVLAAIRVLTGLPTPATVVLVHHAGWSDGGGKETRGRGHSSLEGDIDGALMFDRPDRERDEGIIRVRPKDGEYRLLQFRWSSQTMRLEPRGAAEELTVAAVVAVLRDLGGQRTIEEVRAAVGPNAATGTAYSPDRIRRLLSTAVAQRRIRLTPGAGRRASLYEASD